MKNAFIQTGKLVAVNFQDQNFEDKVELVMNNYELKQEGDKLYAVKKDLCPFCKRRLEGNFIYENVITIVPYTHDTYEYRMAKMLSECEDHLVMDSIVYHYLFIQRHTMVDNVAKNTFWSTEDGIHWDLTKDYDNDTSDGNDNSGYLSYTYGYEFGDSDITGSSVFNAENSVWINFIHALKGVQKDLHQKLEAKGAWRA
jgi:hypothetical protein